MNDSQNSDTPALNSAVNSDSSTTDPITDKIAGHVTAEQANSQSPNSPSANHSGTQSSSADIDSPIHVGVARVDIDWKRAASWWKPISSTLPISWRLSNLLICVLGLVATNFYLSWVYMLFGTARFALPIGVDASLLVENRALLSNKLEGVFQTSSALSFLSVWSWFMEPLFTLGSQPSIQMIATSVAMLLGLVIIWGFVGGCIVRRTIVELGTGTVPSWNDTLRWVRKRYQSILWALTMPVCAALMLCLVPVGIGLLSHIPSVGRTISDGLMIPGSLLALAIGWTLAISLIAFPFSVVAIVTERKADAFDGVSRAGAYLFQRPVLLILLIAGLELISRMGGALFSLILQSGFHLLEHSYFLTYSPLVDLRANSPDALQLVMVSNFRSVLYVLMGAFALSFFWVAQSALYLVVRKSVDSAEFDNIDLGLKD